MHIQTIQAPTIAVSSGHGRQLRRPLPPLPIIMLGFPPPVAQWLEESVITPHAKPEHAFVGRYPQPDGQMTLGAFLVIPITVPAPSTFVIGTECPMPDDRWRPFQEHFGETGRYYLTCGVQSPSRNVTFLTEAPFFLELTDISGEPVMPLVHRAARPV